eukprot:g10310.t1
MEALKHRAKKSRSTKKSGDLQRIFSLRRRGGFSGIILSGPVRFLTSEGYFACTQYNFRHQEDGGSLAQGLSLSMLYSDFGSQVRALVEPENAH